MPPPLSLIENIGGSLFLSQRLKGDLNKASSSRCTLLALNYVSVALAIRRGPRPPKLSSDKPVLDRETADPYFRGRALDQYSVNAVSSAFPNQSATSFAWAFPWIIACCRPNQL